MDNKKLNTVIDFEFYDGTTAKMTLTFFALYQLKAKNKSLYERYTKIMSSKTSDELDMIAILYTAYVCANMISKETISENELMTEEDFIMMCGSDRIAVRDAVQELTQPKKRKDSDSPSS